MNRVAHRTLTVNTKNLMLNAAISLSCKYCLFGNKEGDLGSDDDVVL